MKRIIQPLITLLPVALTLISCHSDKWEAPATGEPKVVEVPVAQLIAAPAQSRGLGPINELTYNEVYMAYGESPAGAYISDPAYTKALKGLITYGITVFQPLLFYPDRNGVYNNIYLKGFYPREGVMSFDVNDPVREITGNSIRYQIDGRHDIMISSPVKGNYAHSLQDQYESDPVTSEGARLRYQHLLSRISFHVTRTNSWPATLKLTDIWVTNVSNKAVLNLSREYTDTDVIVFDPPRDKEFIVYQNSEGLELTTSKKFVDDAMIEPGSEFQVKVRISSGEILTVAEIKSAQGNTINIIGDDTSTSTVHDIIQRGYKYNVTLNFENLQIKSNVVMSKWDEVMVGDEVGWW